MNSQTFHQLSTEDVARLVRADGPKVCGFPVNGTRRWFALEHPELLTDSGFNAYVQVAGQRHLELCRLIFDHGVDTLLTPIFGKAVAVRDETYQPLIKPGLLWFTTSRDALDFYDAHEVCVSVYGDARHYFSSPVYAEVLASFEAVKQRTAHYRRHRLYLGVYADDPAETIAEIVVRLFQAQGQLPSKRQIIEAYYGDYVEPLSFCIGFEPLAMFDLPLVASGMEDLYFTVSPSLYMDQYTLRAILYDHLYTRRVKDDYARLTADDWSRINNFYRLNRRHVIGVGRQGAQGCWWYPEPQVELPAGHLT
jgi:tuberculosinol/isotuberculosinol synthase